jgi:hypothetical protein
MSEPLKPLTDGRFWYDLTAAEARVLYPEGIKQGFGPVTDHTPTETCPWPWDPGSLPEFSPLGQYHCPYCGTMVIAGMRHLDYRDVDGPEPLSESQALA